MFKYCTLQDANALAQISAKTYSQHYPYLWLDGGKHYINTCFNIETLKHELSDSNTQFYLINQAKKSVGILKINVDSGTDNHDAKIALEIQRLYLLEEAAGLGLGKAAINFVIDLARKNGKQIVWLRAMKSSKAVDFYKKLGFEIEKEALFEFPMIKPEEKGILWMVRRIE